MKKIVYVTGSRAEYGIMKRLLKKIDESSEMELTIVATGMHLDKQYGETYKLIEEDGFIIDKCIDISLDNTTNERILNSMSICQKEFGRYFEKNKFDAVMVLGDRFEIFSVSIAAAMHNLPIIHLHGGEKTLGNYDEFIRHAITKMSKLHLSSTEEYRNRIIQMGEHPDTVFNIGALGAENSLLLDLTSKEKLEDKYGELGQEYFVVAFHPETLTNISVEYQVKNLLGAIDHFKENNNFVFIGSNSDTGSNIIFKMIKNYCRENKFKYLTSIKPEEYLGLIKHSQGLIGNSSSGLIEVPSLKVPTLNIGDRQKGRVRGVSVVDVENCKDSIVKGLKKIQEKEFIKLIREAENPYYKKDVMNKAYSIIREFVHSNKKDELKEFYDL